MARVIFSGEKQKNNLTASTNPDQLNNIFRAENKEKQFLPFVPEVHPVLEVPDSQRCPKISTSAHSKKHMNTRNKRDQNKLKEVVLMVGWKERP